MRFCLCLIALVAGITAQQQPPPTQNPSVREIKPAQLRASTSPQTLTIEGAKFETGLSVSVTDPAGEVQTLSGDSIRKLTASSFQVVVTLEKTGHYELVVTNPGDRKSNVAPLEVAKRP